MFIDIAKYVATVAFIGRLFTEEVSIKLIVVTLVVIISLLILGFLTIPPENKK